MLHDLLGVAMRERMKLVENVLLVLMIGGFLILVGAGLATYDLHTELHTGPAPMILWILGAGMFGIGVTGLKLKDLFLWKP